MSLQGRSPFRKHDPQVPTITTEWNTRLPKEKIYLLTDSHLELYPLFQTFDHEHFKQNTLPDGSIPVRNKPDESIDGRKFKKDIKHLLKEVRAYKKEFRDFTVLKKRDFNPRKQAGLLVVKSKKYPFVVKLFMETPRSFVRPYNKGFEPHCIFVISGGATRHLLGFTRIKNAHSLQERLKQSPYWSAKVTMPRKWFWAPNNYRWIRLDGYGIGNNKHITTHMPAIYAIIADYIDGEREFNISSRKDRKTAIDMSNFFLCRIDPHINNFLVERETGKIAIIDTEHFPTMAGFKKRPRMTSYTSWYLHLFTKYIKNRFGRTKTERRDLQRHPQTPFALP
jgi:hypothetical protein